MQKWDRTTTKKFLKSQAASYWPDYWKTKFDVVRNLKRETRWGLLDFGLSVDFYRVVPYHKFLEAMEIHTEFPNIPSYRDWTEFLNGLLKGVLVYDTMIWDSTFLETQLVSPTTGVDERSIKEQMEGKRQMVALLVDFMKERFLVPHCHRFDLSEKEEYLIDRLACYLSRDRVIQRIVESWHSGAGEGMEGASLVLPKNLWTLHFASKLDVSIVSTKNQTKLFDRILWHYSSMMKDKIPQETLHEMVSLTVPYFTIHSIEDVKGLRKERCARNFRKKLWRIVEEKHEDPGKSAVELVRELDSARRELAEIAKSLSHMKLIWGVLTILFSPLLPPLTFPYNLTLPVASFSTREMICRIIESSSRKKHSWTFVIDKLQRIADSRRIA